LPFIEAYTRLGRLEQAQALTMEIALPMPVLRPALCALWQQAAASLSPSYPDHRIVERVKTTLRYCPPEGHE